MKTYVILLRGINVGGKNKIAMSELQSALEGVGCSDVKTYINSGNAIVRSDFTSKQLVMKIETLLPQQFRLASSIIKVIALDAAAYQRVIEQAPKEFGQDNERYRYYVLFLIAITSAQAMQEIETRPGIDTAWAGESVIYFRFPSVNSPDATKSYLSRIVQKPIYKSISMRNWKTTLTLQQLASKTS